MVLPPLQSRPMHTLRRLRALACFMLAWFALSIAAATAAPFVAPQSVQLVCSGAGEVKLLVLTEDGAQDPHRPLLDCPLCVHLGGAAPPPGPPGLRVGLLEPETALPFVQAAPTVVRSAAPLPARGPPAFS